MLLFDIAEGGQASRRKEEGRSRARLRPAGEARRLERCQLFGGLVVEGYRVWLERLGGGWPRDVVSASDVLVEVGAEGSPPNSERFNVPQWQMPQSSGWPRGFGPGS